MTMLCLSVNHNFKGIVGTPTNKIMNSNGLQIHVGDYVKYSKGSNHAGGEGVVGIFSNNYGVMGIGSVPLSKLPITEVVSSYKDVTLETTFHNGYVEVKEFRE